MFYTLFNIKFIFFYPSSLPVKYINGLFQLSNKNSVIARLKGIYSQL